MSFPSPEDAFDAKTAPIPDEIVPEVPGAATNGAASPAAPAIDGWPLTAIEGVLGFPFFVLAARLGSHWALTETERVKLAEVAKPVADKWLPVGSFGPEAALLAMLGLVLAPRIAMTDWKKLKQPGSRAPASTATPASPASPSSAASEAAESLGSWPSGSDPFPAS
jgi:hypothetical protein